MCYLFKVISCLFLMLFAQFSFASDSNDILQLLDVQINGRRMKASPPDIKITDEQIRKADPCKIMSLLGKYENDQSINVRNIVYWHEVNLAKLNKDNLELRQEIVKRLVKSFINYPSDASRYEYILTFKDTDFNEDAKNMIRIELAKKNVESKTILICGVANIRDQLPRLEELLIDEAKYQNDPDMKYGTPWYATTGWAARLARARMGVKEDIDKCVNLIEREININKKWQLLDNLGYIQQPKAIESLKKYTLSNLRLPSTTDKKEGELYASYIINILADNLENFPIPKREQRGYKQDQIDLCRKWMAEQKEWKIIR